MMIRKGLTAAVLALVLAGGVSAADLGGQALVVGSDTTTPPMESIDEATGAIVGFDVDVVNAICARINCKAQFVTTAWDGIFAALAQGEFDMVASNVSITEEREKIIDFSEPYFVVSQSVLVRLADEDMTLDALKSGKKLGAQTGTTNAALAEELVGRANMSVYDTGPAAVLALKNGDVDAVIVDAVTGVAYEQQFAGDLVVAIEGLQSDPLGLAFQEGSELVAAFNEGLAAIKADGTLDTLAAKYFVSK